MLPLLREKDGSGTSTAEERVIGAGLKALERNDDGAAVKELFHMFAVTQEDFMHPMAVIELLWRSCCASKSEKQDVTLLARLKVRQRTQMLVDHSLVLGSSTEGIHLHDLVLQYLRKCLSAEQLRAGHQNVVVRATHTFHLQLRHSQLLTPTRSPGRDDSDGSREVADNG